MVSGCGPTGFPRRIPVERQAREIVVAREIEHGFGRSETLGLDPLERAVDTLITERQFDIDRCTRSA